jgi:hypothetical protein
MHLPYITKYDIKEGIPSYSLNIDIREGHMDSTLIAGFYGLGGSLVGACVSYYVGRSATSQNIRFQLNLLNSERMEELHKEDKSKSQSAKLLENDICTAVSEAMRVINNRIKPGWGGSPSSLSFNANYYEHLSKVQEHLNLESIIKLNKIYGLLKVYQESTYRNDIDHPDIRRHLCHIGIEMFGEKFEIISNNINHDQFTKEILIEHMNPEYAKLFKELSLISGE